MDRWSSNQILPGYERLVIGYDIRQRIAPSYPGTQISPLTVDSDVWVAVAEVGDPIARNGFNYLDVQPLDTRIPSTGVLISLDSPASLVERIAKTFGLRPQPLSSISKRPDWHFCGFDIIDHKTGQSALFGFEWTGSKLAEILDREGIELNEFGLVESEATSIDKCQIFDQLIEPHSPFSPCGVWRYGQ